MGMAYGNSLRPPPGLPSKLLLLALTMLLVLPSSVRGSTPAETPGKEVGWMRNTQSVRPNILLVTADTLRHDHTGWTDRWPRSFTPHLDAFAAQATRFSAASTTATSTRPAIASLLTGRYPGSHSVFHNGDELRAKEVTLTELLSDAGYSSASFFGNGLIDSAGGYQQGVDLSEDFSTYLGSSDEKIADRSIAWLEKAGRASQPFFLWVHFMDPHGPYFSAPRRTAHEVPASDGMASRELPLGSSNYGPDILPKYQKLKGKNKTARYRRYYRAEVKWMDQQFGRILAALDSMELRTDTLVIFTADHGESLGEHDYHFQHGALVYEPTANVPLAFRLPGRIEAGRKIDVSVSHVDLLPTLIEGLALPHTRDSEGRSLGHLLRGGNAPSSPSFGISGWGGAKAVAVRRGAFKLAHTPPQNKDEKSSAKGSEWELFDLQADPRELKDVSASHPEIRQELEEILLMWVAQHKKKTAKGTAGPNAQPTPLSPELSEKLRRLGYIDD